MLEQFSELFQHNRQAATPRLARCRMRTPGTGAFAARVGVWALANLFLPNDLQWTSSTRILLAAVLHGGVMWRVVNELWQVCSQANLHFAPEPQQRTSVELPPKLRFQKKADASDGWNGGLSHGQVDCPAFCRYGGCSSCCRARQQPHMGGLPSRPLWAGSEQHQRVASATPKHHFYQAAAPLSVGQHTASRHCCYQIGVHTSTCQALQCRAISRVQALSVEACSNELICKYGGQGELGFPRARVWPDRANFCLVFFNVSWHADSSSLSQSAAAAAAGPAPAASPHAHADTGPALTDPRPPGAFASKANSPSLLQLGCVVFA
eukprot:355368-Chlamydomonas_euryale.AAC.4